MPHLHLVDLRKEEGMINKVLFDADTKNKDKSPVHKRGEGVKYETMVK